MKYLHSINKTLVIINSILGFTIYLGLLFLIPLGITQIIMTLILISNGRKLTKKIMVLLTVYSIITTLVLIDVFIVYTNFIKISDALFMIGMYTSVLLAFLHLYITFLVLEMQKSEKKNLEIKKEVTI